MVPWWNSPPLLIPGLPAPFWPIFTGLQGLNEVFYMAFTGFVSVFYRVFTGFCATFIAIYRIYRILQDLSHSKFTTSGLRGPVYKTEEQK